MNAELIVFLVYLVFMVGIGVYFFLKSKDGGEKGYFLGGREMGPWVSALSAGASDMSAWVLMGLPASIYAAGLGRPGLPSVWPSAIPSAGWWKRPVCVSTPLQPMTPSPSLSI